MVNKTSLLHGIILPIIAGSAGLFTMAWTAYLLQAGHLSLLTISGHKIVNFTFTMQLYVFPLSILGLLFLYLYDRSAFHGFFKFHLGKGSTAQTNWQQMGPVVLIAFAVGTAAFMSINVVAKNGTVNETFFKLLPLVILFSATNAWTEEIVSRFVIVGGLYGKLPPVTICWISAIIFGLPHFPSGGNGIFGVVMAGLLGWFLARSVVETKSLGWALLIHFLLDIIVFGAGAMIIAGSA